MKKILPPLPQVSEKNIPAPLKNKLLTLAQEDLSLFKNKKKFLLSIPSFAQEFGQKRVNIALGREGGRRVFRLALAYLLTREKKYLNALFYFLEVYLQRDWTEGEGDLASAYWLKGYLLSFNLLADEKNFQHQLRRKNILEKFQKISRKCCLYQSAFLKYGYDLKPIPGFNILNNNHNLIAAITLGLICLFWGWENSGWFKQARQIIDDYLFLSDKLGPDGDWFENTPFYQFFWLYFFLLWADVSRYLRIFDYYSHPKIKKAFEIFFFYLTPAGNWIGLNDGRHEDSFHLTPLLLKATQEYQDGRFYWLMNCVDPELKKSLTSPYLEDIIYYWPSQNLPAEKKPDLPLDKYLRKTGVVISRTEWSKKSHLFIFNCGDVESHSHLDKGSFEFYYQGKPMMLDPGVGSYVEREKWIFPPQHNLPVAEEGIEFQFTGEAWGNEGLAYDGKINCFCATGDFVFVEGTFSELAKVEKATRAVLFSKTGYLIILDQLKDSKSHLFHNYFHGAGSLKTTCHQISWVIDNKQKLILKTIIPRSFKIKTGFQPVADHPQVKDQHFVDLQIKGKTASYLNLIYVKNENFPFPTFRSEIKKGVEIIRIKENETESSLWIFQKKQQEFTLSSPPLITDAKITFIRMKKGEIKSYLIKDGNYVSFKGRELVSGYHPQTKKFRQFKKRTFYGEFSLSK
jgi:hypothetical protein